ncbi:torsin-1A [Gadus morhua]|uniref:torsin-1A n=1 Tax=Gadus morhua TaxID=8049 RepID=UPI0011B48656|nr:torsin-1A-like [Gadus morhua]
MNSRNRKHLVVLLLLLVCTGRTDAFFRTFKDWYDKLTPSNEECTKDWISFDGKGVGKGLKADLQSRLFGQHIAAEVIMKAVDGLMNNDNPKKPMVLSFHGRSGTGKNLACEQIVKNIYKEGMDSRFVHFFNAAIHFPHISEVETYKSQLQHWIRGNVTNCAHSMFIFDEMDKMHAGAIDGINPFMDYQYKLDGVSYSKAIFIFLSNSGSTFITQTTLDSLKAGKEREKLKLKDMETALSLSTPLFIYRGVSNVVDYFIPFLPLESRHIVQCIMVKMKNMGLKPEHEKACELADEIVNYFPKDEKLFSSPGCKTIASRLRFYM